MNIVYSVHYNDQCVYVMNFYSIVFLCTILVYYKHLNFEKSILKHYRVQVMYKMYNFFPIIFLINFFIMKRSEIWAWESFSPSRILLFLLH